MTDLLYPLKWLGINVLRSLITLVVSLATPWQPPCPGPTFQTTYLPTDPPSIRPLDLHIYLPPAAAEKDARPLPIYVNIHGCGFCLTTFGQDRLFCGWLAEKIGCVVVDMDHRKAPEHPFPAAINDIRDVLATVGKLAKEKGWDAERVAIGGFSSGGCLALAAAARAGKSGRPLKAVCAFYPSTNLAESAYDKPKPPKPTGSGTDVPAPMRKFFYSCFCPTPKRADPLVSPLAADPAHFPPSVTIITAECDSLAREGRQLVEKLEKERRTGSVKHFEAKGQGHGWDKSCRAGTEADKLRWQAYELARDRLKEAFA